MKVILIYYLENEQEEKEEYLYLTPTAHKCSVETYDLLISDRHLPGSLSVCQSKAIKP